MDPAGVKRLREDWGFVVTDDRDPDLLGWLVDLYLTAKAEELARTVDETRSGTDQAGAVTCVGAGVAWVKDFVEFARARLRENPPVTFTYLPRGIAVQLQNYQQLVLVEPAGGAPDTGDVAARGVVPVTNANRGGGSVPGFRQTDTAAPITGAGRARK